MRAGRTILAAATVLCAVVAAACDDGGTDKPAGPSTPTAPAASASARPSPSAPSATAHDIADADNAVILGTAVDGHGDLLTVWSRGYDYTRVTALAIDRPDHADVLELGRPDSLVVAALHDGWVVGDDHRLERLDPSGNLIPIASPEGPATSVRTGDVVVPGRGAATWLYRPATGATYALDGLLSQVGRGPYDAAVARGVLVALSDRGGRVSAARWAGGRWLYTDVDTVPGTAAATLDVVGRRLVVSTTYHPAPLGDDEEDPLHLVAVSMDGGRSWRASAAPADERVPLSATVTRSGTAFVAVGTPAPGGGCPLLRWGARGPISCADRPALQVFAAGDRVFAVTLPRPHHYRLLISDDQGATWRPTTLPGHRTGDE